MVRPDRVGRGARAPGGRVGVLAVDDASRRTPPRHPAVVRLAGRRVVPLHRPERTQSQDPRRKPHCILTTASRALHPPSASARASSVRPAGASSGSEHTGRAGVLRNRPDEGVAEDRQPVQRLTWCDSGELHLRERVLLRTELLPRLHLALGVEDVDPRLGRPERQSLPRATASAMAASWWPRLEGAERTAEQDALVLDPRVVALPMSDRRWSRISRS